ncbi:DUF2189 domain-containing protein [Shewanella submarina]|uniref:DUF2189 domain-containing protein n=1 Tax=Shewanella submarina TaxID=2016376 RepID=A0ABV7GHB7_9GAMM|nr:DUF2189 domain-containing protein [Shewanella submarina]MCL1038010.1 DUF2189 domain-containing protein [Shewanella submarina]
MAQIIKPDENSKEEAVHHEPYARTIPSNKLDAFAPLHWLALALNDFRKAPVLSLSYGALFTLMAFGIFGAVYLHGSHLVILPTLVIFVLAGPFLATGLYDISWELEKGHSPSLGHALHAMGRNSVSSWGFAVLLAVIMIFWTRVAALLHALYPATQGAHLEEYLPFLALGSLFGTVFAMAVFGISAFSLPLVIERKVDMMTAIFSSVHAVHSNPVPMILWAGIILMGVLVGFATAGIGLMITMPVIAYATWHGYIATIHTKHKRHYE